MVIDSSCFPPVIDHQKYPTCAAAVITALAGFHVHRVTGRTWVPSLSFNYFTSRVVGGFTRGEGSRLDWCLAAWHRYGMPDEASWPFREDTIDELPSTRAFRRARAFRGIGYRRLDTTGASGPAVLDTMRRHLANRTPVTVEYPLNPVQSSAGATGLVPALATGAREFAKHVVLAVGYDDTVAAGHDPDTGDELTGAVLIRNSWGLGWGTDGHAWLPYQYVLRGLTGHHWITESTDRRALG